MTDRELFEWLKREGECWHEFIPYGGGCTCGYPITEKSSLIMHLRKNQNPNLTSPDWPEFGWAKDRLVEKKLFVRFCNYCWEKLYGVIPPAVWGGSLPQEYIDPPRFISTLYDFLQQREQDK